MLSIKLNNQDALDRYYVSGKPVVQFNGNGNNLVTSIRYSNGRVYINSKQYFEVVQVDIWRLCVGGYQVCMKWLVDRKRRRLTLEEIKHYCQLMTALNYVSKEITCYEISK